MEALGICSTRRDDGKKDDRAPNKAQKAVGLGSFVVMIIVVKYL